MLTRNRSDETSPTVRNDDDAASSPPTVGVDSPPHRSGAAGSSATRINRFVDDDLGRVIAAVSLWCGSPDDAEQAVADATGRAWERLDRGRGIDNLAAWITTVAMNDVRSSHRRRATLRRKGHLVAAIGSAPGAIEGTAERIDLQRALNRLGERQRQVVALHYGLGMGVGEIAIHLGIASGTVKATLHASRRRLATELGVTERDITDTDGSPS